MAHRRRHRCRVCPLCEEISLAWYFAAMVRPLRMKAAPLACRSACIYTRTYSSESDCKRDTLLMAVRNPPLPPLAKGIPFIGDTFDYLKIGAYYGIPHHKKHGDIYRYAC